MAHTIVARVPATVHFSVNQRVSLAFAARHTHFFDPVCGAAIA